MNKPVTASLAIMLVFSLRLSPRAGETLGISSPAFQNGGRIPVKYTCDGSDVSPELAWAFKGEARSFAVTCTDPDAPGGTFVHWVMYNIPPDLRRLAENQPKTGRAARWLQGKNDFGRPGYNGPCPPPGRTHRYIFTVYALDVSIEDAGLGMHELMGRMKGRIRAQAQTTGIYGR